MEQAATMGREMAPEELLPWNMDRGMVGAPL